MQNWLKREDRSGRGAVKTGHFEGGRKEIKPRAVGLGEMEPVRGPLGRRQSWGRWSI